MKVPAPDAFLKFMVATVLAVLSVPSRAALELVDRIELPGSTGRLDHLAVDAAGSRLFVAALASDAIDVVDPTQRKRVLRLRGREPQGLAFLPSAQRLLVANGGSGTIEAFVGDLRKAGLGDLPDVDNLRIDGKTGLLYAGYSDGLAVVDPLTLRLIARFALPGHPESFQLAANGPEIYINVPTAKRVIVLDRQSGRITATWDVAPAARNFPMSLDETEHRLLIATRQPARLQVFDTASGRRVAEIPLCGDADDLFFDAERRQAYAVCGEGRVEVVRQVDPNRYEVAERVDTAPGARTGLYAPALGTLFVAAPSRLGRSAEVQVYRVK
jgi:sugar lactone lactonase YvrE